MCCGDGTDCSAQGWKYVWWNTPLLKGATVVLVTMWLTGVIVIAARGQRDMSCPDDWHGQKCWREDCRDSGIWYDCTCSQGHCVDQTADIGSATGVGVALCCIGGLYILVQLCRMCCCARRPQGFVAVGDAPSYVPAQPTYGAYGAVAAVPVQAAPYPSAQYQAQPSAYGAPANQQVLYVQMPNGNLAQVSAASQPAPVSGSLAPAAAARRA